MAAALVCVGVDARQCDWCGADYVPFQKSLTCSPACKLERQRLIAREKARAKQAAKGPAVSRFVSCEACGAEMRWRGPRHKTCSRACYRQVWERPSRAVLCHELAKQTKSCLRCGSAFTPRTYQNVYCTAECEEAVRRAHRRAKYTPRRSSAAISVCRTCGSEFVKRDARQASCSVSCSAAFWSPITARTRRARKAGAHAEQFDPIEVLERDGWRCHLCGVSTPRRLRGTKHPRAPHLDHIVPLAAGGAHTRANTACACARCNTSKGAKPLGQLRLLA